MFDPYHKWLGIPPKDQPPNYYRLLAINLFESDAEVIDTAANRQMLRATAGYRRTRRGLTAAAQRTFDGPRVLAGSAKEIGLRRETQGGLGEQPEATGEGPPAVAAADPLAFLGPRTPPPPPPMRTEEPPAAAPLAFLESGPPPLAGQREEQPEMVLPRQPTRPAYRRRSRDSQQFLMLLLLAGGCLAAAAALIVFMISGGLRNRWPAPTNTRPTRRRARGRTPHPCGKTRPRPGKRQSTTWRSIRPLPRSWSKTAGNRVRRRQAAANPH